MNRWALFYHDVTAKGDLTQRNQIMKYDVFLTTADRVCDPTSPLIRDLPFTQVIVDHAHIKKH